MQNVLEKTETPFIIVPSKACLSGHFPDNPVIPGALILEHVMLNWLHFSTQKIQAFDYCKFMNPVLSSVEYAICFSKISTHKIKDSKQKNSLKKATFIITTADHKTLCKGRLVYG